MLQSSLQEVSQFIKSKEAHSNNFFKQSDQTLIEYKVRLNASIDCIQFLLRQGLAFHGHDESRYSKNQGNFLELLRFLADHNETIRSVVLKNAPKNLKLTAPDIQKDNASAAATETTNVIINELRKALFSILIDESRDIYQRANGHCIRFCG